MKSSAVSSKSYLLVTSLIFLASTSSRCVEVLTRFILVLGKWLDALLTVLLSICNDQGEPRGSQASRSSALPKILPIETPAISLDELKSVVKKLDPGNTQELDSDFAAQLSIVSRLKHEHFVELLGYCLEANNRILIYQYAMEGSLHDILHAKGLEYLHEKVQPSIVHQDVRSSNGLIFDEFLLKIADFNLTNQSPRSGLRLIRLECWELSDIMLQSKYAMTGQLNQKSDVYSVGVVLLELLTGRKPVNHTMPKGQQSLVTWATPRLSEDKVKQCINPKLKLAAVAALCVQYEADFCGIVGLLFGGKQSNFDISVCNEGFFTWHSTWKEGSTGGYTWPCSQLEPKSQPFTSLLTC
ncbi:hypothetical protein IFM89_003888 [Coptis chinensis]|uniref:Protein kinase domain-containing protein n=1 Tax=Coptis chinensis TaxID=261450 RepID=A0A835I0Y2_9MAGN|nr:hypothetical protein IFM89_003888 [Coptis chinensis]